MKAADFSVAQQGIVEGCKVTGSQLNPHPVESFSGFHLPHLFMCESRGRKTNLWLLFHPCTRFPSEDACCRLTGAMFIFIHMYLLKWAVLCLCKGEFSQYHKCVHAFIFNCSQTLLKKKAPFLFKNWHVYRTHKHCHERHSRKCHVLYKQVGNRHALHTIIQNYDVLYDIRNSVNLFMCWDILSNKIKYILFALSKVPNIKMYHSNTMFFGHVPWSQYSMKSVSAVERQQYPSSKYSLISPLQSIPLGVFNFLLLKVVHSALVWC